jgi:WD40 repeat protein
VYWSGGLSYRVVTASDDKTARVWDATTGKSLTPPLEHQQAVKNAAFSPDGTCVVTASDDKTARMWHIGLNDETLEEWSAIAERSPFVVDGIALVRRSLPGSKPGK